MKEIRNFVKFVWEWLGHHYNYLMMDFADLISPKQIQPRLLSVANEALINLNGQISSKEYAALEEVLLNNIIPKIKSGDIKRGRDYLKEFESNLAVALNRK